MKVVVQRVTTATVRVNEEIVSEIGKGFLLLVGIHKDDDENILEKVAQKILGLRIFTDSNGKMNENIFQAKGTILSVPQFTLLGDTSKGNRPGFDQSGKPEKAKELWKIFNNMLKLKNIIVKEGAFGEHMQVSLTNDGPVTFIIEK